MLYKLRLFGFDPGLSSHWIFVFFLEGESAIGGEEIFWEAIHFFFILHLAHQRVLLSTPYLALHFWDGRGLVVGGKDSCPEASWARGSCSEEGGDRDSCTKVGWSRDSCTELEGVRDSCSEVGRGKDANSMVLTSLAKSLLTLRKRPQPRSFVTRITTIHVRTTHLPQSLLPEYFQKTDGHEPCSIRHCKPRKRMKNQLR